MSLRPILTGVIVGAGIGVLIGGVVGEASLQLEPGGDIGDEIINGALIGAGIGGIVGLVVAPRSKAATRSAVRSLHIVALPRALVGRIALAP